MEKPSSYEKREPAEVIQADGRSTTEGEVTLHQPIVFDQAAERKYGKSSLATLPRKQVYSN